MGGNITLLTSDGYKDFGCYSKYVDNVVVTKRPDIYIHEFENTLLKCIINNTNIVQKQNHVNVVVVIPVIQEVMFVSKIKNNIMKQYNIVGKKSRIQFVVSEFNDIVQLNNKFLFQKCVNESKLFVPQTSLVFNKQQTIQTINYYFNKYNKIICKPVYGFGNINGT